MPDNSFRDDSPTSSDESQDLEDIEREIRIMKSIEAALREFQDYSQKKCFDCTWNKVINPDDEASSAFFIFIFLFRYAMNKIFLVKSDHYHIHLRYIK
jgi:hypothetical protein